MKPLDFCPTPPARAAYRLRGLLWASLAAIFLSCSPASAALTDISSEPLITTAESVVKPNIMFVLDDSGSMAWDFMPDDASFGTNDFNTVYGRRAIQCNGLGFNPEEAKAKYLPPLGATGTPADPASTAFLSGGVRNSGSPNYLPSGYVSLTNNQRRVSSPAFPRLASTGTITLTLDSGSSSSYFAGMVVSLFGTTTDVWGRVIFDSSRYLIGKVAAWNSGTRSLTIDIAMSVGSGDLYGAYVGDGSPIDNVYYTYSGSQTPPRDYRYPGNNLDTGTTFYQECSSAITADPGKSVFTAHIVTPDSAIAQRYANWYYYYSTRMLMMKTSATYAFKDMDDKFRIGYSTIGEKTVTEGSKFLNVRDFDATQKDSFYTKLMGAYPGGSTPLRASLSKIGRYYAKQISGQTYDPVQYSCQKNFTILSTDGYWNTGLESSTYGPFGLNGSTNVGQQDGGATKRPMFDGGSVIATTTETWINTSTVERTTVTPQNTVGSTTTTKTTTKPRQGWQRTTYSLAKTQANSSVSRCSSLAGGTCTITVINFNHGLATGDRVTLSGITPSDYNGNFAVTVLDSNTYTYVLTGLSSRPVRATSAGVSDPGGTGCPIGQGRQVKTVEAQDDLVVVAHATTDTTTTPASTSTVVDRVTTTTSMKRVLVLVNGVVSSDQTTKGAASDSVTRLSGPTLTPPTPPVVSTTATTTSITTSSTTSPWVTVNSQTLATCVSNATASVAASKVASFSTTESTVTASPVVVAPVTVPGTPIVSSTVAVTTDGPKTTTETSTGTGGSSNTLADVAMYYYKTDLRSDALGNCTGSRGDAGGSVCTNNVKPTGNDDANWQHMTTFTLSLGMSGTIPFDPNYATAPTGTFKLIVDGSLDWPAPGNDAGAVNIDDLWHAAINGRGQFFSASDAGTLTASLNAALNSVRAQTGASSAAATSTLQPVAGETGVFIANFTSRDWIGDLRAYDIDIATGVIQTTRAGASGPEDTARWSASAQLTSATARNIYYLKAGSLATFDYAAMPASIKAYFDGACSRGSASLTQCASVADKSTLNSGANMVDFLSGKPHSEYRLRKSVLGDIINSSPVYVGKPSFAYTENGYAAFKADVENPNRKNPTIYVGANDGMLHAINAETGQERWAYIPTMVMPNMYKLADSNYDSLHQFFVDATPVVGDVYVGGKWRTILVGGLNAGGRGYYALDVSNPLQPVALWEFTHDNLGLSYGNPVITKRKDGTWIVAFGSGYNNVAPGDGKGYLYILNAYTGAKVIEPISTNVGSTDTPSGLGRINAWIDSDAENLAKRFYAGDLLGNVWRFDIDGLVEPKNAAFKLAELKVGDVPQPITVAPQLAEVAYKGMRYPVVYLGTGRYLGKTDVGDIGQQSIYAIKDVLGATSLGDVRAGAGLVKQSVTESAVKRVVGGDPVDWSAKNGWYVDLTPATGQRVNVDMQLAFDTLTVAGNVPGTTATDCTAGSSGTAWIYQLNIATGAGDTEAMSTMVAGLSTVQLGQGTGLTIITKTDATQPETKSIDPSKASAGVVRRSSWRELVD